MRERGIVRATTKEIAREAGCSEALLYKNFADKHELFVATLTERLPRLATAGASVEDDVVEQLVTATTRMVEFYQEGFPIAASLFGDRDVLIAWRQQSAARGGGPDAPRGGLERQLQAAKERGRIGDHVDTAAVASLLTGAALHEAFLATFAGERVKDPATVARHWVNALDLGIDGR